jgi:hypothetical protein
MVGFPSYLILKKEEQILRFRNITSQSSKKKVTIDTEYKIKFAMSNNILTNGG